MRRAGAMGKTVRLSIWMAGVLALAGTAWGQVMAVPGVVVDTEEEAPQAKSEGFSVPKEDQKYIEALDDFSRYAGKKQWELAFKAISGPAEADLKGMVPAKDGFYVPVTLRIKMLLAGLPSEGKQAYRLFYDAKARQLLEGARNPDPGKVADEVGELRKIVDEYFITSVGDQAADALGDLYFERGDFVAAVRTWDSILTNFPDSGISKLKLHVKKATALARAGQADALAVEIGIVQEQFPGQNVTVGGREVSATEYLASLKQTTATTRPTDEGQTITLPQGDAPRWQMQFVDPEMSDSIRQALQNMGWQGQMMGFVTSTVPPSATDGKRIYVNWLGVGFALDAQTGKLLWRTDKFSDLAQNFQQMIQWMVDLDRYSLTLVGDSVIINRVPLGTFNRGIQFQLSCHEAATGKVKWSTLTGPLANWSFVGQPLLLGQTMYMTGNQQGNAELRLAAIDFKDGKLLWEMKLGTPQSGPNYRGEPQPPQPKLMYYEGMLYVLTNNGAILAVNLAGRKLEWALTYEMPPQANQQVWWGPWGPQMQGKPKDSTGLALIQGGVLYLKEAGGGALYAVDLSGPSLKWRRPVGGSDMIAGMDDKCMYFIGEDLSAMDLKSRDLVWSAKLPQQCPMRPLISGGHVFVALARGIYEMDTSNGDTVRIFRGYERDAEAGRLYQTKDALICVSNRSVTAYPVKPGGTAQARQ